MKKFNMFALIALSLAVSGGVDVARADDAIAYQSIIASLQTATSELSTKATAAIDAQKKFDAQSTAYDTALGDALKAAEVYEGDLTNVANKDKAAAAAAAAAVSSKALNAATTVLKEAKDAEAAARKTVDNFNAAKTAFTKATTAIDNLATVEAKAQSDAKAAAEAIKVATTQAAAEKMRADTITRTTAEAAAAKKPLAVAKKIAPTGTTAQGTFAAQNTKAVIKGLTGSANTVSKNQLSAMKTMVQPTTSAVAQTIAAGKTPITATGSISAKTSANAVSKMNAAGFSQGAQINNTSESAVQGSTNQQGAATAASSNNQVSNYSGANLVGIGKSLTGSPAAGKAQKGIISQGISGAMNLLDSDTKNKGGLQITGGKDAAINIRNGFGGLGNLTNRTTLTTNGASNVTGDVTGSQNSMTFIGSEMNSNT